MDVWGKRQTQDKRERERHWEKKGEREKGEGEEQMHSYQLNQKCT